MCPSFISPHQVSSPTSIISHNQFVLQPTHFHPGSPSIVHLVFIPESVQGSTVVTPPLITLLFSLPSPSCENPLLFTINHKERSGSNFNAINASLSAIDWSSTLPQDHDPRRMSLINVFLPGSLASPA